MLIMDLPSSARLPLRGPQSSLQSLKAKITSMPGSISLGQLTGGSGGGRAASAAAAFKQFYSSLGNGARSSKVRGMCGV